MTLIELVIYLVILSVLLGAVYQLRGLIVHGSYRLFNSSVALVSTQIALRRIKQEVQKTESAIRIFDQPQSTEGLPEAAYQRNCIEMDKTVNGTLTRYSISLRWNEAAKGFRPYFFSNQGCNAFVSEDSGVALSDPIFQLVTGKTFFSPAAQQVQEGYPEVDFNYVTSIGEGNFKGGVEASTVRLSANLPTPHECRVASTDPSWFSNYADQRIRSLTVSITLNFDPAYDRLSLLGQHDNIISTSFDDFGVLHLFANEGLTVSEWLSLIGDVQYQRPNDAPRVTPDAPPKRITFTLGEGLPYSPAGTPSSHFYMAVKFDMAKNFADADAFAKSICYPSFASDNFLGQNATQPDTGCNTGAYPRLTGHLVTLTTEGEHEFVKGRVLKMVYPEIQPSGAAFHSNFTRPSSDTAWMGGEVWSVSYNGWSPDFGGFKWSKGYEISKANSGQNQFADIWGNALQGDAAGFYYVSLQSDVAQVSGYNLYFDIAGNYQWPSKYWGAQNSSSPANYAIIEFGDNRNANGGTDDERTLNSSIKLKKDITLVPFEFFNSCRAN
jgi:Tfp pilus assembly protein PilE